MLVADADVVSNGGLERPGTTVHAPAQLLLGQPGEPTLDQVDPGGPNGSEVQMKARTLRQPASDHGRLVGGIVVQDQVNVQLGGHRGFNGVEEFPELDGAVPLMTLADDLAGLYLERRKERRGPA